MAQVLGQPEPGTSTPPEGAVFEAAERVAELPVQPGRSLITADIDGDGRQDLLLLGPHGAMQWRADGRTYQALPLPQGFPSAARSGAFGDLENDGRLDLVLCGASGITLWQVDGSGRHAPRADVLPAEAGAACHDVQLFDADHDGDLDIYRVGGAGNPGELLNNNLDGSWRALSADAEALRGPQAGAVQMLVVDAEGDRDLDLVFLDAEGGLHWLRNDRLWAYEPQPLEPIWQEGWGSITMVDLEVEGRPTLLMVDREGRIQQGRLDSGELAPLALPPTLSPVQGVDVLDADGDGREDLLLRHAEGLSVVSRDAGGAWRLLWEHAAIADAALAVLEDPARGPALIFTDLDQDNAGLWRAAPGPGRWGFVALAPSGRSADADGMRSNASGIGTEIRLRRGAHWSIGHLLDRGSGAGQSLQPIAFGVGDAGQADFVELQWSDGVMQTELALPAGKLHRIEETQRQLASCPVLFAWDGERFRFVSDLLGVGGIGFLLAPGQYAPSRPWEYFRLPDGLAVERDGAYRLKIAEPMEEAAYLDSVRLHVYDLPPGWSMSLDERMHTGGGPAPTGAPLFYRTPASPAVVSIRDGEGGDLTATLREADFEAVDPGPRDPRFLGRLAGEQRVELHLVEPLQPGADYAVVGNGWVEYPYSQTLFAAWQAGADYRSYSLDLGDGRGSWREAYAQFGYPAGMPREFALPLPRVETPLPALRLRGNLEVYLDRLDVVRVEPAPEALVHRVLSPDSAQMQRIGFPRREVHAGKRPDYDYGERAAFWDTRYPVGAYTDFGPVEPLLEAVDDGFAIVGPGDALDLSFEAPPAPPEGYTRVLVLEARGYAKDMDLYTRDGGTLGPMPITAELDQDARAGGDALNRQFNQRFQGGR
nr:CRTAC1 family protein [Lysobacter sp. CAU 1642]